MKRIDNIMSFWGLVLLLVIGGLAGENVRAQNGYSFFRNFSAEDYQGHNRNFDIACDISLAIRLEWSM